METSPGAILNSLSSVCINGRFPLDVLSFTFFSVKHFSVEALVFPASQFLGRSTFSIDTELGLETVLNAMNRET